MNLLKYPNFFIQLKNYQILNTTIEKVYTLVNGNILEIFDETDFNFDIEKSICVQMFYIVYVMLKEKLIQADLNRGNMGYIKTHKKYVILNINNQKYRLKTYGYLVSLLDTDIIFDISGKPPGDYIGFSTNLPIPTKKELFSYFSILFNYYKDFEFFKNLKKLGIDENIHISKFDSIDEIMECIYFLL